MSAIARDIDRYSLQPHHPLVYRPSPGQARVYSFSPRSEQALAACRQPGSFGLNFQINFSPTAFGGATG